MHSIVAPMPIIALKIRILRSAAGSSLLRTICNPQTGNSKRENGPVNEKIDTNAISAAETNLFFDGAMSKIENAPTGKIH